MCAEFCMTMWLAYIYIAHLHIPNYCHIHAHTHLLTHSHTLACTHSLSGIHGLHSMHQGEGSACIRGRGQHALGGVACLAMASWMALLMSGECTVAKPEASSASDLACTSCRLGMSHPLVATDCRKSNCQQACSHYNTSKHMIVGALTVQAGSHAGSCSGLYIADPRGRQLVHARGDDCKNNEGVH